MEKTKKTLLKEKLKQKIAGLQTSRESGMPTQFQQSAKTMKWEDIQESKDFMKGMKRSKAKRAFKSITNTMNPQQLETMSQTANTHMPGYSHEIKKMITNRIKAVPEEPTRTEIISQKIYIPKAERVEDLPIPDEPKRKKRSFPKIDITVPNLKELNREPEPEMLPKREISTEIATNYMENRRDFTQNQSEYNLQLQESILMHGNESSMRLKRVLRSSNTNHGVDGIIQKWLCTIEGNIVDLITLQTILSQLGILCVMNKSHNVWTLKDVSTKQDVAFIQFDTC